MTPLICSVGAGTVDCRCSISSGIQKAEGRKPSTLKTLSQNKKSMILNTKALAGPFNLRALSRNLAPQRVVEL